MGGFAGVLHSEDTVPEESSSTSSPTSQTSTSDTLIRSSGQSTVTPGEVAGAETTSSGPAVAAPPKNPAQPPAATEGAFTVPADGPTIPDDTDSNETPVTTPENATPTPEGGSGADDEPAPAAPPVPPSDPPAPGV